MKLVDTNVWLAIALSKHDFHTAARDWLITQAPPASVAFCRATQQSFLRLITTSAATKQYGKAPLSNADAWAFYERLLADARIVRADEPAGLEAHWKAASGFASPKVWIDAYLASFAIAGGHQFVTIDRAFRQFATFDCVVLSAT